MKASENIWFNRDNITKVEFFDAIPADPKMTNDPDFSALEGDDDGSAAPRLLVHFVGGGTELVTGDEAIQMKQRLAI